MNESIDFPLSINYLTIHNDLHHIDLQLEDMILGVLKEHFEWQGTVTAVGKERSKTQRKRKRYGVYRQTVTFQYQKQSILLIIV